MFKEYETLNDYRMGRDRAMLLRRWRVERAEALRRALSGSEGCGSAA